jgi:hypothetical protein
MTDLANLLRTVHLATDNSETTHKLTGERLVILRWKEMKKDGKTVPKLSPDRCVSLPIITLAVTPEVLKLAAEEAIRDMQDAMVREMVEKQLSEKKEAISINLTDLTAEKIASWFADKAERDVLSTKRVTEWFDNTLAHNLGTALAKAMGLPDEPAAPELAKWQAALEQHKKLIVGLASPRATMQPHIATSLKKAVALAPEGDSTAAKLTKRLDAFLEPKELTLSINL